jgi:hemolysin activation/secretion protein
MRAAVKVVRRIRSCPEARATRARVAALAALLLLAVYPVAQARAQVSRPAEERPELPSFEPPEREEGRVLPPIEVPRAPDTSGIEAGLRVFIREYRITGNTVLPPEQLADLAAPYAGREVSFADIMELRDGITAAYIEAGYVNSGATIPPQSVEDGVLEIRIVEGVLGPIDVETDGRFRESYFRSRLRLAARGPLNVYRLEERLQLLLADDRIRSLDAQLLPGRERGEASLRVSVSEERPWRARLQLDNHQVSFVGQPRSQLHAGFENVSGWGDRLSGIFTLSEGLSRLEADYVIPLNAHDTTLRLRVDTSYNEVVTSPFDDLDVEGRQATYRATLRHPMERSLGGEFGVFLTGEYRRTKTLLLGEGFSFSPGVENGESSIAVLRFGHDWTFRGRRQVLAARSQFSWGLDALGATAHSGDTPDGQYLAWLGQVQYARRLPFRDVQLLARADAQFTNRPLLPIEQIGIGGHDTVRGYHQNEIVRDNGLIGSIELRLPVLKQIDGPPRLELASFFDIGRGWNRDRTTPKPRTLTSAGLGARVALPRGVRGQLYWGYGFRDVPDRDNNDLQDHGIHFAVSVSF